MNPSIMVFDNFLDNPDQARVEALGQQFTESGSYKGFRALGPNHSQEIVTKLDMIFDATSERPIQFTGSSFMYHYTTAGTPEVYHADTGQNLGDWAAVLFLKPGAPLESGTSLFRHRRSGIDSGDPSRYSRQPGPYCYLDITDFEETDYVANVYNRMVIFASRRLHSMRRPFGYSVETARLTQLFFFKSPAPQ